MPMQCTRLRTYRQSYGQKFTYYLLVRWLTKWRQVDLEVQARAGSAFITA